MRIAFSKTARLQANAREQVTRTSNRLAPRRAVYLRTEGNRFLDGQTRVERRITVLKHHLNLSAKRFERQLARTHRQAVEHNLARSG